MDKPSVTPSRRQKDQAGGDIVVVHCSGCRCKTSVLQWSVFKGLKMGPGDLYDLIQHYVKQAYNKAPNVNALIQQTGFGKTQVLHVVDTLLAQEAKAGKYQNDRMQQMSGNVEGDATAVRRCHVSEATFCACLWVLRNASDFCQRVFLKGK